MWVKLRGECSVRERQLVHELMARCQIPVEGLGMPRNPDLAIMTHEALIAELAARPRDPSENLEACLSVSDVTGQAERFIDYLRKNSDTP